MKLKDISIRIQQLVEKSNEVLSSRRTSKSGGDSVDSGLLAGLRSSTLSFISMVYGKDHPHYTEFKENVRDSYAFMAEQGHQILLAIQNEIEGGWIFTTKQLITSEIFSDFLEMSEYLLSQNYKDPAAVMIGSVLEEHLRQLCISNEIEVTFEKDEKMVPKKADLLNSDLVKAEVYSRLDQKAVTTWLDLRNKAAHGHYEEYNKEQVVIMYQGVLEFITRTSQ